MPCGAVAPGRTELVRKVPPDLTVAALEAAVTLGSSACTTDLAPQSLVDRFRILAVRAGASDASPGEIVTLDVLLADPADGGRSTAYYRVACQVGPARDPGNCADLESSAVVGSGEGTRLAS